MSEKQKSKNVKLDEELSHQLEVLCKLLHTNFSSKTKELLVEWKINELDRLKDKAPELYEAYQEGIKNPVSNT
ncbi:hypothetical protein [Diaphorobacter sp.]|uniref:hypothetical protein n=1 Tax=Diaphorobacter sp. TaxID=1934310 RepID=UPI003D0C7FCB